MKNRSRKLAFLFALVVCATVTGSVAVAQISRMNDFYVERLSDLYDWQEGFILRERDGYIGIFYRGAGYPAYITTIPIARLSPEAQEKIAHGIAVPTKQKLIQMIEDLGG